MFTVFHNSTTAYASEVMGNFYHIFDGDRLPRGGDNFEPTTGVYDIGSSTYAWNNIYCTNLIVNTVTSVNGQALRKITSISLTPSASSYEVTGLPETRMLYVLFSIFTQDYDAATATASRANLNMVINGISASSYGYQMQLNTVGSGGVYTLSKGTATSLYVFPTITANAGGSSCDTSGILRIYNIPGGKPIISTNIFVYSNLVNYLQRGVWTLNDSSTITSLKFISDYSNFITGSSIEIWGMA